MRRVLLSALFSFAWSLYGCGDDSADADAGLDASADASTDTRGVDTSSDVPLVDVPREDAPDVGVDAPDAGIVCECPVLPSTCDGITLQPVFSPDDPNFGQELMQVLACAERTVHAALHDVEWDCLVTAFQTRLDDNPELEIEIVVDATSCPLTDGVPACALSSLASHERVSIAQSDRTERMRHNFITTDSLRTWISSAELTEISFCDHFNHSLVLEDATVVSGYEEVFLRMFFDGNFGHVPLEDPRFGGVYALYFSPQEPPGVAPNWFNDTIREIGSSTIQLDVMMARYDSFDMTNALLEARDRGVELRVLVGDESESAFPVQSLRDAGVDVRTAAIGHRVLVADTATVITGSVDWTPNSYDDNANSLWIGDAAVAASFVREFERIWAFSD